MDSVNNLTSTSTDAKGKVINVHLLKEDILPANTIFVGPGSRWMTPFREGTHGSRADCNARYNELLASQQDVLMEIDSLKGRDLACHCVRPGEASYADTLVYLASIPFRQRLEWAEQVLAQNPNNSIRIAA